MFFKTTIYFTHVVYLHFHIFFLRQDFFSKDIQLHGDKNEYFCWKYVVVDDDDDEICVGGAEVNVDDNVCNDDDDDDNYNDCGEDNDDNDVDDGDHVYIYMIWRSTEM